MRSSQLLCMEGRRSALVEGPCVAVVAGDAAELVEVAQRLGSWHLHQVRSGAMRLALFAQASCSDAGS